MRPSASASVRYPLLQLQLPPPLPPSSLPPDLVFTESSPSCPLSSPQLTSAQLLPLPSQSTIHPLCLSRPFPPSLPPSRVPSLSRNGVQVNCREIKIRHAAALHCYMDGRRNFKGDGAEEQTGMIPHSHTFALPRMSEEEG